MAHRYSRKRKAKKGTRKRASAARKRWNAAVRRYGSKAAAHRAIFGGKRGKVRRSKTRGHGHRKSAKRVAAGRRLFLKMAARHGGVANYKRILRARLARARR